MDASTLKTTKARTAAEAEPSAGRGRGSDDTLKSLTKIVRILECFSTADRALSLAELCDRVVLVVAGQPLTVKEPSRAGSRR